LSVLDCLHGKRILDVGTGAGLPGIPLALCAPDRQFVLLDSNGKKIRFVEHAAAELGLGNVLAVQVRVAEYAPERCFDTVISRAFSSLEEFASAASPLLCKEGRLVAMKGRFPEDELHRLPAGWAKPEVRAVSVPGLDAERHIVVLRHSAAE